MSDRPPVNDPKQVWQELHTQGGEISAKEIRMKAEGMDKRVRLEWKIQIVAGLMLILFVWVGLFGRQRPAIEVLSRIRPVFVTGLIVSWIIIWMRYRRRSRRLSEDAPFTTCLEFYRRELQRQHNLFEEWPWRIVVVSSVLLLTMVWAYKLSLSDALIIFTILGGLFALYLPLRKWVKRKIQHEIDALDAFEREDF